MKILISRTCGVLMTTSKCEGLSREIALSGDACRERRILSFLRGGARQLRLCSRVKFVASLGIYEGKTRREVNLFPTLPTSKGN
jgi:hypothetical protein